MIQMGVFHTPDKSVGLHSDHTFAISRKLGIILRKRRVFGIDTRNICFAQLTAPKYSVILFFDSAK